MKKLNYVDVFIWYVFALPMNVIFYLSLTLYFIFNIIISIPVWILSRILGHKEKDL